MDNLDWTDHGLASAKATESSAAFYAAKVCLQTKRMQAGPRLALDGYTLIVPSEWYNEEAAKFWKFHGFRWNPSGPAWERDTGRLFNGKKFTADAWLESTRRQFAKFWPSLRGMKACRGCKEEFEPASNYEILCPACQIHYQGRLSYVRRKQEENNEGN